MNFALPEYIKQILQALNDAGFAAYVVGGAVRDMLAGITPGDFDVATNARPQQTEEVCRRHGWQTVDNLGQNYGCVVAIVCRHPVEITTFRGEAYGSDAHKPQQVWFCDNLREDLSRRDFTVNAMALDLNGRLYDYFNGLKDLQAQKLRTVGQAARRYREDALRMLRACRFTAQLGFDYEQKEGLLPPCGQPNTPYYLPHSFIFPSELCAGLSLERVRKELDKTLAARYAGKGLMLFLATGLANASCRVKENGVFTQLAILPELAHLSGLKQNPRFHCYNVWEHTLAAIDNAPADLTIRWALLLHDVGKGLPGIRKLNKEGQPCDHGHEAKSAELAQIILTRLRYPEKFIRRVVWLVARHMRFAPMLLTGERTLTRFVRSEAASGQFRSQAELTEAFSQLTEVFLADMGATHAGANNELMREGRALSEEIISIAQNKIPVCTKDLALQGKDVRLALPDADVKSALNYLLARVQSGSLTNEKDLLLAALKKHSARDRSSNREI